MTTLRIFQQPHFVREELITDVLAWGTLQKTLIGEIENRVLADGATLVAPPQLFLGSALVGGMRSVLALGVAEYPL